jgi:uncharacterized membrane protein required for colicin V production
MDDSVFLGMIFGVIFGVLVWAALSRIVFRVNEIDKVKSELALMRTYMKVLAEKLAPDELAAARQELAAKQNKSDTSRSRV